MGVIKYISSLIELLTIPCRVSYVPVLRDILLGASPYNWRLRQMIASQFKDLVPLLPIQNLYATLFPLAITLIQDRIAEVRYSILPGIAKMITVVLPGYQPTYFLEEFAPDGAVIRTQPPPISENEINYLEAIVLAINALIVSDAYIYRQIWCELSAFLLLELPSTVFEKYYLHGIIQLTSDPITNVRVKVAELLTKWDKFDYPNPWEDDEQTRRNPWKWLLSKEKIQGCIERLSRDDRDVYNCVRKLQPIYPHIEFVEISCRGLKIAPGGPPPVGSPSEMIENMEINSHDAQIVSDEKMDSQEISMDGQNLSVASDNTSFEADFDGNEAFLSYQAQSESEINPPSHIESESWSSISSETQSPQGNETVLIGKADLPGECEDNHAIPLSHFSNHINGDDGHRNEVSAHLFDLVSNIENNFS